MANIDGLSATRQIAARAPTVRILLLTASDDVDLGMVGLRAGAAGHQVKGVPAEEIVAAVRRMAAGEPVVGPELTWRLIDSLRRCRSAARACGRCAAADPARVGGPGPPLLGPHRRPDLRRPRPRARHRAHPRQAGAAQARRPLAGRGDLDRQRHPGDVRRPAGRRARRGLAGPARRRPAHPRVSPHPGLPAFGTTGRRCASKGLPGVIVQVRWGGFSPTPVARPAPSVEQNITGRVTPYIPCHRTPARPQHSGRTARRAGAGAGDAEAPHNGREGTGWIMALELLGDCAAEPRSAEDWIGMMRVVIVADGQLAAESVRRLPAVRAELKVVGFLDGRRPWDDALLAVATTTWSSSTPTAATRPDAGALVNVRRACGREDHPAHRRHGPDVAP